MNFSRIICTNFRQGHASGFWGAGLCGWNCRHTFFAVFPELGDPPTWTEESLQELNARNIEYNGKLYTQYEVNQMQRVRERNVRRWKKRYLAETAAGVDKILSESISMGGALQQSIGGIETLFADSADKVKAYAADAWRTVGLSANDYMEQTTSFAASLLASVSKDTQAAADLANMAMVDMADSVSKCKQDRDIAKSRSSHCKELRLFFIT